MGKGPLEVVKKCEKPRPSEAARGLGSGPARGVDKAYRPIVHQLVQGRTERREGVVPR